MGWLFWGSLGIVLYAYIGYWLVLRLAAHTVPTTGAPGSRSVSVVVVARNEASRLAAKLTDLRAQRYGGQVQIIVLSDGSTDGTAELLAAQPDVLLLLQPVPAGKAAGLNVAVAHATGELLVFFDARQRVGPDTIRHLTAPFDDAGVGVVSGELMLLRADGTADPDALGLYWRIEKSVRQLESASGSVVGATGAIYAMRRELFVPLPAGLILDDVWLPMHAARTGARVIFQPAATASDQVFAEPGREFRRKVRTLKGNFELLRRAPWLLTPANPLLFRFVSHKLLRLVVPYLLVVLLLVPALAGGLFYRLVLAVELFIVAMAVLGALNARARQWRVVSVPYTFALLNVAAGLAFYKFLARQDVWN